MMTTQALHDRYRRINATYEQFLGRPVGEVDVAGVDFDEAVRAITAVVPGSKAARFEPGRQIWRLRISRPIAHTERVTLRSPFRRSARWVCLFNNCAPADAGPSASSASLTTVCASSTAHPVTPIIAGAEALRISSCATRRSLGHISAATSIGEARCTSARNLAVRQRRKVLPGGSGGSRRNGICSSRREGDGMISTFILVSLSLRCDAPSHIFRQPVHQKHPNERRHRAGLPLHLKKQL
jgi:hypothetical protein